MLRELRLRTIKCIETLHLPLAALTVLTGLNSGGKSTVLQALVLLGSAMRNQESTRYLALSPTDLVLGTVEEIVNSRAGRRHIGIGLTVDEHTEAFWIKIMGELKC